MDGAEEIMFDGNAMGEGHGYFALRGVEVSPDNKLAVFGIDTVGRRFYTLRVKNLATGEILPDVIQDVTGNVTWAMDNRTLFYTRQDPETLRSYQIWRHELGTDTAQRRAGLRGERRHLQLLRPAHQVGPVPVHQLQPDPQHRSAGCSRPTIPPASSGCSSPGSGTWNTASSIRATGS